VTSPPAATDVGAAESVTARSASPVTFTGALAVLFDILGSCWPAETLTASSYPEPGVTELPTEATTVTVTEELFAIEPSEQLIPDVVEHDPCDGVADTTEKPAGSVSVSVAPVAPSGPWFVTVKE
jgi:hypothetical protein